MMSEQPVRKGRKNSECCKEKGFIEHLYEMILATSFLTLTDMLSDNHQFPVSKIMGLGMKIR